MINYNPSMYSEQDIFKAIAGGKEPTYGRFGAQVLVPLDLAREDGLYYAARELSRTIINDAILPVLYSPIFVRTKLLTRYNYQSYHGGIEIMADMDIQNVEERPVVYKFVAEYSQIPKDVYRCDHCGGHTKNDMRGNCLACGAPRNDNYLNGW